MIKAVLIAVMMWSGDGKMARATPSIHSSMEQCEAAKFKTMTSMMEIRMKENPKNPVPDFVMAECYKAPGLSYERGI